jgi:hypothetical protein
MSKRKSCNSIGAAMSARYFAGLDTGDLARIARRAVLGWQAVLLAEGQRDKLTLPGTLGRRPGDRRVAHVKPGVDLGLRAATACQLSNAGKLATLELPVRPALANKTGRAGILGPSSQA